MAVYMLCTLCMLLMTACAGNGREKPEQNEAEQAYKEATGTPQKEEKADPDSIENTKGEKGKNNPQGNSGLFSNSQKSTSEKNPSNNKKDNWESDLQGTTNSNSQKNNQGTAQENGQDNNKDDIQDTSRENPTTSSRNDFLKNPSDKSLESQKEPSDTSQDSSKNNPPEENPTNTSPDPSQDASATIPSTPSADAPPSHTVCTWDSGRILQEATCTEAGRKLYTCTLCGKEKEERIPATGHSMEEQWFGEMPSCDRGSYLNIVCSVCGFVQSSESVPALGCVSDAGEELFHGNCREETIVVYHCIRCGRETGFDRHYEPDEHDWITARTDPEWDEEAFDFVSREVTCCSRCGIEKGAQ